MVGFDSAEFAVVKFDIVTIFPRMFEAPLAEGVVGRGIESGIVDVAVHDLRDFTTDRHRTVDDVPFGGGPGMVLKAEPLFRAVESNPRDTGGTRGRAADVAAGAAVHPGRGRAAARGRARRDSVRTVRGRGRPRS